MADHKTKIGGTNYNIKLGKTKIGGTDYNIKLGKTKIGGTDYTINWQYWLYNNGPVNGYTFMYTHGHGNTSGGDWSANPAYEDTYTNPALTSAYLRTGNGRSQGFMLNQPIDLTRYNRIFIKWRFTCSGGGSLIGNSLDLYGGDLTVNVNTAFGNNTYFIASSSSTNLNSVAYQRLTDINGNNKFTNSAYLIHEFDISSITGSWYIDMYQGASLTSKPSAGSYCNQLWLE